MKESVVKSSFPLKIELLSSLHSWNIDWWAPKMGNDMGLFCLLFRLNPPFSLVYCIFLNIFMLIEWIGLVIFPCSLICALCRFFGQFWTKSRELWANGSQNSRKTGKRICRGGVPFIYDPFPRIFHQPLGAQRSTLMIPRGNRASKVGLMFISSSRKLSSLILGGLLEDSICINKKAQSLSRLTNY